MSRLKLGQFGIGTAVVLILAAGAFIGLQFIVKWGTRVGCGKSACTYSVKYGFPVAAFTKNTRVTNTGEDTPPIYMRWTSAEPLAVGINIVALISLLVLVASAAEKFFPRSAAINSTDTDSSTARNPRRPSFPRECP